MAVFNDINCQVCDRFITKEQWNKHFFLVDFYIEKETDIGLPFFHEEN